MIPKEVSFIVMVSRYIVDTQDKMKHMIPLHKTYNHVHSTTLTRALLQKTTQSSVQFKLVGCEMH